MSRKEVQELLEKARRSLAAAEIPCRQGYGDFALSRSYYAMFYSVRALLLTRGIHRTKHSGIIAAFNEAFVRTGELSRELFLSFRDAFEDRAEGDYGFTSISDQQARSAIAQARDFIVEIEKKTVEWLHNPVDGDFRAKIVDPIPLQSLAHAKSMETYTNLQNFRG